MKRMMLAIGIGIAVLLAGGAYVYANREVTRFRLSYGPEEITVASDIVYVAGSAHPKHRLDVYAPKGASSAPVVHFVHGGYWTEGDKDFHAWLTSLYGSVGVALAKRGIVTVVQSYRLAPEVGIDAIVDDVMAGLRWTEMHAKEHGGDQERIFMMGHSAGGHLVALIGSDPSLHESRKLDPKVVAGYIPISAIWDVAGMYDAHDEAFNTRVTHATFGQKRADWAARSPLGKLHPGMSPFFVVIGERDYPYMIPQAERARARLSELGEDPKFLVVPTYDHAGMVLAFGTKTDRITDPIVDFVMHTKSRR